MSVRFAFETRLGFGLGMAGGVIVVPKGALRAMMIKFGLFAACFWSLLGVGDKEIIMGLPLGSLESVNAWFG